MAYTWDKADAPGRRTTQYFEMFGSRAIYHDGWIASAPPVGRPGHSHWQPPPTDVMNDFKWELYNLDEDWTQANDLAAKMPDKLRDMQQLFIMQAEKYNVFPLDDSRLAGSSRTEAELIARPDRVRLYGRVDQRAVSRISAARRAC